MDLKEKLLAIAIAIIFVFFVVYGFDTFYSRPQYDDYCGYGDRFDVPKMAVTTYVPVAALTCGNVTAEQICTSLQRQYSCQEVDQAQQEKINECMSNDGLVRYETDTNGCSVYKECDMCSKEFQDAQENYNRLFFILAAIVGLVSLVVGIILKKSQSVGVGIMGGGILTITYGTLRYWGNLGDIGRFVILGLVLAVLIWVGYKKFSTWKPAPAKRK